MEEPVIRDKYNDEVRDQFDKIDDINWNLEFINDAEAALSIFVFYPKIPFFEIEDAFYDKIQNTAYSYSESWHTRDSAGAVDG
jgi:hypothetical protein